MIKRILAILLAVFLAAQLAQPDRTVPAVDPALDMLAATNAPPDIAELVTGACYDCHSYRTEYPVWAYVTPFNFWIQDHIGEGREKVNFSRWDLFAGNEEAAESGEAIAEGEMPPASYAAMHDHGRLTGAEKEKLRAWFNAHTGGAAADEGGHDEARGDD